MNPIVAAAMQAGALQKADELEELYPHVAKLAPKSIIEIGCDAGGTLKYWTSFTPDVLGIDLPTGNWGTPRPLVTHGATVILGNSHNNVVADMATAWVARYPTTTIKRDPNILGQPYYCDLLFIDGDHTYDGVKKDYEWYGDLVRPGGMIVFQDIVEHDRKLHPDVDVHRFWKELSAEFSAARGERINIVSEDGEAWGGIGVLWK